MSGAGAGMSGLDPAGLLWLAFEVASAVGFVGLCVYAYFETRRRRL
ncbi:MAG: hypothetical protein AAF825_08460 [Pseudomonadota bacterium]